MNLVENHPEILFASHIAAALLGYRYHMFRRRHRQFVTTKHVPHEAIEQQRWIAARVVKVVDSDNVRVNHTPRFYALRNIFSREDSKLKNTIHVRLSGIDAPEGAHFGMTKQPLHDEAKAWLTKTLPVDKKVHIKLLRRDQYGRIVGTVMYRNWLWMPRNVSVEMLRNGWATIYKQAGAEYDGNKSLMEQVEAKAKRKKLGVWSLKKFVTPADHKKNSK